MRHLKIAAWLLPLGIAVGSLLTWHSTGSAQEASGVPVATAVPVATSVTSDDKTDLPEELPSGMWTDTAEGRKYCYADGSYAVDVQVIDGISYLFRNDGVQMTGWQNFDNAWHYYDPKTYTAAVGVQQIEEQTYLFDYAGVQKTGWRTVDGVRRYYDAESGKEIVGWVLYGGNRYYVTADGGKLSGECEIEGVPYLLDAEYGSQQLGFQQFSDGKTRYYHTDGTIASGWMTTETDGNRYYFDENYVMQVGLTSLEDQLYYFSEDGAMRIGWQNVGDARYHFGADGTAETGLQKIAGSSFYFADNGVMQKGWQTLNGNTYYFSQKNGAAETGIRKIGDSRYYFGKDGIMGTGWQTLDGNTYYFSEKNGAAVTGMQKIDGRNYRFTSDGILHIFKICLDAGHYGKYNISPVNHAYYESDMSWKLHLYLKTALEGYGFEVITTRPTQAQDLGLETRGKMSEGCDLFLSLHSNAAPNTTADGPLACCTVTGKADALGLQLANLVHQVMGTRQGGSIWKRVGMNGDYYGVLRGATSVGTTAILLEHSYHTNLAATNWLLSNANLEKLAKAEAKLLAEYFGLV